MNLIQRIAAITGVAFILVAILGFATTGFTGQMTHVTMESAPKLLGLFPVNPMHNAVHLLLGLWGVAAARRPRASTAYAAISGIIYLLLAALGFLAPTMFGMIPIGGYDIVLHFVLAIILIGCAFLASLREEVEMAA
ncbi:MAG TPA: DUF4383 domain-containing protein [Gemmatimonadaceae bacterium]